MAQDGVSRGLSKYDRTSFMIRSRLFKGLCTGKMSMRSLFDDERHKMLSGARCAYCGSTENLSVDHLLPRAAGGSDNADNLICCCRRCNSSKGDKDMLQWFSERNQFPPLLILRRYLKLVFQFCLEAGVLDADLDVVDSLSSPYSLNLIPTDYPAPDEVSL
ncbi:MAG: HNH endonuclease [Candidatus Methanomethylophilus sp.]|nr:HNH endonuclease [Methanomethylophilus sp.]